MTLTVGVSASGDPSRVVLHLIDDSKNKIPSLKNEHANDPFPSLQPHEESEDRLPNGEEGDLGQYHLVVQGPIHMQGTPQQAINYINSRINPKDQEPRMYFRPLPAGPEQDTDYRGNEGNDESSSGPQSSLVELVISTNFRDDVQVQVEQLDQIELFLQVISGIHIQTFYLRDYPNGSTLPNAITTSLDKALSKHPTLKRLWLQAFYSTTVDSVVEEDFHESSSDKGVHYSIAASILKHPQSCIQDIMVEGYGHTRALRSAHGWRNEIGAEVLLSKHTLSFFRALEDNCSVHTISFVKTHLRLHDNRDEAEAKSMILRLGRALCNNRSIEKLYLGNLLEYLSHEGIESFAKSIRQMKGLKVLDLRLVHRLILPRPDLRFGNHMQISPRHQQRHHHFTNHFDSSSSGNEATRLCLLKPIIDALEDNCSLTRIPGWKKYLDCSESRDPKSRQIKKEIRQGIENALNYQLQLNRSRAKQFVHEPTLSIAAWSLVLEKSRGNPTAMYYCLRHKVITVCL
ncbi:unnamed protein product [Cylindrotheca closterium]|uniref:Uncharacterized protein n=1 Tax=Cylindrotheca closterium TaxID=2856 RepID=A0AAD2FJQ5_9STRA|nr:unnamed protein product [Cylindrotheca closterium]